MSVKAELTKKDIRFLQESLNGNMWKVILRVGTPLALYEGRSMLFAILDTMMAAHISEESVSAVAYLAQINNLLSAVGGGLAQYTTQGFLVAGGGALFFLSDMLLVKQMLFPAGRLMPWAVMITYESAQLLFAASCLFL